MRANVTQLKQQFRRAVDAGWLPLIRAAADKYSFTPELLLAIGSRETNLDPKYQRVAGDRGHGFSMWQIDIGSFPTWIKTGAWRDVGSSVMKSAQVLDGKRSEVKALARAHGVTLSQEDLIRITVAAYNHGSNGSEVDFERTGNPDRGTTGGDYSRDVLARRDVFQSLLQTVKPSALDTVNQRNNAPVAQNPVSIETENQAIETKPGDSATNDDFLNRLSANARAQSIGRSAQQKLANRLGTPISTLLAALEAGDRHAWIAVSVIALGLGVFIYFERRAIVRQAKRLIVFCKARL